MASVDYSYDDEEDPPPPPPPEFDSPALIIDNGTGSIRAGLCGSMSPSLSFRTLIGRPVKRTKLLLKKSKVSDSSTEQSLPDLMYGSEIQKYIGMPSVELSMPIVAGAIVDWDAMEKIWSACFSELEINISDHPVVLPEPPMQPRRARERTMEIFFETFEAPAYYSILSGSCALYASGRTTGLVLDIGEGVTHITPVYESFAIGAAINRHEVAGATMTQYFARILSESGYNFGSTRHDLELARSMKESVCFLRNSSHPPFDPSTDTAEYELPDGQIIRVREESYRAAEVLFQPMLVGSEAPPLHEMVHQAIQKCGIDMRKALQANIVLSGGTSLIEGITDRLLEEFSETFQGNAFNSMKIIASKDRGENVWVGASVVATLPTMAEAYITKESYNEVGSACLPTLSV